MGMIVSKKFLLLFDLIDLGEYNEIQNILDNYHFKTKEIKQMINYLSSLENKEFYQHQDLLYSKALISLDKRNILSKDLNISLVYHKSEIPNTICRIFAYFGDKDAFYKLDFKSFLNNASSYEIYKILRDFAKCYKNFGNYNFAENLYTDILKYGKELEIHPSCIMLLAKFFDDFYQRQGLYQSLIEIAYSTYKKYPKLNEKQKYIIFDSFSKINPYHIFCKSELEILNRNEGRFSFTEINNKVKSEKNKNAILSILPEYIRKCNYLESEGNFKGYYERKATIIDTLLSISFSKEAFNIVDNKINEFLQNAISYSIKTQNIKLEIKLYKIYFHYNISNDVFPKDDYEFFKKKHISDIQIDQPLLRSKYYIEIFELLIKYFIDSGGHNEAIYINKKLSDLLEKLLSNLEEDEFALMENNTDRQMFIEIKNIVDIKSKDQILGAFRIDYKHLTKKILRVKNQLKVLLEWQNTNLINSVVFFNNHKFATKINSLAGITKDKKIIAIASDLRNILKENYASIDSTNDVIINISEEILHIITEYQQLYPNENIIFENETKDFILIEYNLYVLKHILRNLINNIMEVRTSSLASTATNIALEAVKVDDEVYLKIKDNIGNSKNLLNTISNLNANSSSSDLTLRSKGNGLLLIKKFITERYVANFKFELEINDQNQDFKRLSFRIK